MLPGWWWRQITAQTRQRWCLRWCHHDAMGTLILSAERGKKIPWVPLLLGWECLLMDPGTEPCCATDSACDVRSPFLHPLSEQVCSTMFKVAFRSSVLCAFKAASSRPPNLTTSRFLNGWKRVCCVQGHICGEQAGPWVCLDCLQT